MPTASQREYDEILAIEERRKLEHSFRTYVRRCWEVLHPFENLIDNYYIDAIAEHLQAVYLGQITRLIINQPPRTLKSTLVSIMFPTWIWVLSPWWKFVFYSYSFDKLSVPMSLERRRVIQSAFYQSRWGEKFSLSVDENMKWKFSNSETGAMEVVSQATGTGGNMLIVDDPHSVTEALSDAERESGVTMVRQGLMSRLNNPQRDPVIVVQQRLHDSDVTGEFLRDGGWTHLCLPAQAEVAATIILPISNRVWKRKVGDLLDPVRLSEKVLDQKKRELGSRAHAGQYQQDPAPPSGSIFNTQWWRWYNPEHPPQFEEVVLSVDAAFKGRETSDDVAVHAYGMVGIQSYLIARDTRKMGFAATKAAIRAMVKFTGATIVLIEDKANGSAIIEELKMEFHVISINPDFGDKVARAEGCSPMVEAGTVFLPENSDGVKIQTLAAKFPNADKDDIDALTQFLNWRRKRGATMKWFEAAAKKAQSESGTKPEQQRIEHPTINEVHRLSMEQAGMKVSKPSMSKQVKVGDLKKDAGPDACAQCGSTALFRGTHGSAKCNSCGHVMSGASREVNIG